MKESLLQVTTDLGKWLRDWVRANVDFAFVLAVFTETPRWTVTFLAIHEPLWIGVPLGVMLAFATSKAWKYYFATRSWKMFTFNVAAIALAVFVIAPVLYAMIGHKPDEVDITNVLPNVWVRWAWSSGLALTTFIPLVQLAVVHGHTQPQHTNTHEDGISVLTPQRKALPEYKPKKPAKGSKLTDEQKEAIVVLHRQGRTYSEISAEVGPHVNTIGNFVRSLNGVNA